ncbi:hypothetical protein COLO4_06540 [Corchorus olitorius]|uniref:Uncharacterized protein n=1 Tax=Corchorus olitorius TaxID=93759 RepID=A0A1R3KMP8_9ROSI|nr:hypothetical protein COLO4_06540 [Corchorus olitorius]
MERQRLCSDDDDDGENTDHQQKLHQIFEALEQEWDFIKQRPERSSSRSSKMIKNLRLLNTSPRQLMSSLQDRSSSPTEGSVGWKMRTNDLAVEEILTERRAAIETGKLKGRRLFVEEEEEGAAAEVGKTLGEDESEVKDEETILTPT